MKKVFMIHGLEGTPNGGWRSWLMSELQKKDIYACSLSMPNESNPTCSEWVDEINRVIERNKDDEIYLIGHSLGVPTILHYLEQSSPNTKIAGVLLISGPSKKIDIEKISHFLEKPFDFETIKSKCSKFAVIHGDDDPVVPLSDAAFLSEKLKCDLVIIHEGKHLNGSAGFTQLPECLKELELMFTTS
ncbi:alpha/beta fold hydrolase [Candidatus Gracilibacteria bacterium]|nr:alpha/beta fold hydrolase [Candidatus Gracilibacteria bacterium]MCF7898779.1 alpha/beta fold hydrolase [Candidatus Paceibacterota bacterium]